MPRRDGRRIVLGAEPREADLDPAELVGIVVVGHDRRRRPGIRAEIARLPRPDGAPGQAQQRAVGPAADEELGPVAVLVKDVAGPAEGVLAGERLDTAATLTAVPARSIGSPRATPSASAKALPIRSASLRPGHRPRPACRTAGRCRSRSRVSKSAARSAGVGGTAALVVAAAADPISSSLSLVPAVDLDRPTCSDARQPWPELEEVLAEDELVAGSVEP